MEDKPTWGLDAARIVRVLLERGTIDANQEYVLIVESRKLQEYEQRILKAEVALCLAHHRAMNEYHALMSRLEARRRLQKP